MQEQTVAIKGNRDGLLIILDPADEWNAVLGDLAARIDGQASFFAGARITLELGGRPVRKDEMGSVKALLERRGLLLFAVNSASMTTIDSATALDLRAHYNAPQPTPHNAVHPPARNVAANGIAESRDEHGYNAGYDAGYDSGYTEAAEEADAYAYAVYSPQVDGTQGMMIRHTLRSGRTVQSAGHVVILGDVNAGAEVIAVGDVVVWGRVRGNIHAGADGDDSAVICALDMMPTQLRIGGYLAVSPPEKRGRKPQPEVARVEDGQIVVDLWSVAMGTAE